MALHITYFERRNEITKIRYRITYYIFQSMRIYHNILTSIVFLGGTVPFYFDIGPIVEGLGSFGRLGLDPGASLTHDGLLGATTRKEWQHKSRLYHMTRMNSNASRRIWS